MTILHVPRLRLAEAISAQLVADPIFGSSSGLFLSAPRRTGKSAFLRRDLVPLLKERGDIVLYVDLWADRSQPPEALIAACVDQALRENGSRLQRVIDGMPVERASAFGLGLGIAKSKSFEGTIADACVALSTMLKRDIVFIVDEAQRAIETEAGLDAMFSLKAARDAVNQSERSGNFFLLMTGSHRDKLADLVIPQSSPFLGARMERFPPLDRAFAEAMAEKINERLSEDSKMTISEIEEAMTLLGSRPEALVECIREAVTSEGDTLVEIARMRKEKDDAARSAQIEALPALQRKIVEMLADRPGASLFSKDALQAFGEEGKPVGTGSVQHALDSLRKDGLVWRTARGQYELTSELVESS